MSEERDRIDRARDLTEIQREQAEARHRNQQAARRRYAKGVLSCRECGEAIDERRRQEHAAIRCLECQADHERQQRGRRV